MGLHGCDASRDTADVILTGDSFNSIVLAIEEGTVYYFTFSWIFTFRIPITPFSLNTEQLI